MGFYSRHILPRVVHLACSSKPAMRQRQKIVPLASGRVLEVGLGSGLNLPFYDAARIERVWGLEPSMEMAGMARRSAGALPFPFEIIGLPGEQIPLEDHSVDTVVVTYTLCTIQDTTAALAQMRRVLRPGGRLLFCEHGLAPDRSVRRQQSLVGPAWRLFGGGCNLDRDIPALLAAGGFRIEGMASGYIPGWRAACFNYWGSAVPR